MPITWDNKKTDSLVKAVLALKNSNEAKRFLRDLLTPEEIDELGNRWKAAKMLSNKIPYTTIRGKTGLSSTTIARISKWLNRGKGGYKLIISRLNASHHTPLPVGKGLR